MLLLAQYTRQWKSCFFLSEDQGESPPPIRLSKFLLKQHEFKKKKKKKQANKQTKTTTKARVKKNKRKTKHAWLFLFLFIFYSWNFHIFSSGYLINVSLHVYKTVTISLHETSHLSLMHNFLSLCYLYYSFWNSVCVLFVNNIHN